jgi:hypothetical protein
MENELITLNQFFKSHKVYWIKSLLTLKKWVKRDLETNNYLKTKVIERKGTGTRYYIPISNVDSFVQAFNDGKLYDKKTEVANGTDGANI